MSLLGLPSKVQSQIFSYLVTSFGPSQVLPVLTTCKQLYDVALPLSVRVFRNTAPLSVGHGPCSERRNAQFLRYILVSKPELAKHVKMVILGSFDSTQGKEEEMCATEEELSVCSERINSALRQHQTYDKHYAQRCADWITDLGRGCSDAQVALILLVCPNINVFYFETPRESRNFYLVLEMANVPPTSIEAEQIPLSKLRHIYCESADNKGGHELFWEQAVRLFQLPSLRTYETTHANGAGLSEKEFGCIPHGSSSVEEITLNRSIASGPMVRSMLGSCKALKSFSYSRGLRYPTGQMLARDLLEGLLPHANTLQTLDFNLDDERPQDWLASSPERLFFGAQLREMTALSCLKVGMQSLTGMISGQPSGDGSNQEVPLIIPGAPRLVECLPENLRELHIRGCGPAILDQAAELLEMVEKGEGFNQLRHIRFLFDIDKMDYQDVKLRFCSPSRQMCVVFQNHNHRGYDLGAKFAPRSLPRAMVAICSRIFSEDFREEWLSNQGRITVRNYEAPSGSPRQPFMANPGIFRNHPLASWH